MFGQKKTITGHLFTSGFLIFLAITANLFLLVKNISYFLGTNIVFVLSLSVVGIALLIFAKLPSIRSKKIFSFGFKTLDQRHKRMYIAGYLFIIISLFAQILFICN